MFEPLAREEALFVGHPIALVIAETETAAADAVAEVYVDAERLPVVTDLEAAMRPESPLARITSILPAGEDRRGEHGQVRARGGRERGRGAARRGPVGQRPQPQALRLGRQRGRPGRVGRHGRGDVPTNWVYQGYMEPHASTAWIESGRRPDRVDLHPGHLLRPQAAGQDLRPADQQGPGPGRAAGRLVRVQGRPRRPAGRRRGARPPPARPARVRPARGHGRHQPGARLADRPPDRRDGGRHADRARCPAGLRHRRLHRMVDRGHRRGAHRRGRTAGRRSTSGPTACGRTGSARARTAGRAGRRRPSRSSR